MSCMNNAANRKKGSVKNLWMTDSVPDKEKMQSSALQTYGKAYINLTPTKMGI
jgi:hypothetical protein